MRIKLHIQQLLLEGLPLSCHDEPRVRAAVVAELSRLLVSQGLPEQLRPGASLATLPAATLRLESQSNPRQLGRQVARSVFSSLDTPVGARK